MEKITSALRRLELSGSEQRIYLSLLREGRATARILAARTGITRPSVYDQLKTLIALGLVIELDIDRKAHFAATELKYLDALLLDRIDRLTQSREALVRALPSLEVSLETVTPKLRFFEGEEGVKQLLKDCMWHSDTTLYMTWNPHEMQEVLDAAFLGWFDERRQKRHLQAHMLWSSDAPKAMRTFCTKGTGDKSRVLKKGVAPTMSSIIYGHKVAYISSGKEAFGFIVESTEHSIFARFAFDALWENGKGQ